MALIKCPKCGKKILKDSKLCSYCGYPLVYEVAKKVKEGTESGSKLISDQRIKKRTFSKIAFIVGIACMLILAVIMIPFMKNPITTQATVELEEKDSEFAEENIVDEDTDNTDVEEGIEEISYWEEVGNQYLSDEKYDEAYEAFCKMEDSVKKNDILKECVYEKATYLMANEQYLDAYNLFLGLDTYKDSVEQKKECAFQLVYIFYNREDYLNTAEFIEVAKAPDDKEQEIHEIYLECMSHGDWFYENAEKAYEDGDFSLANRYYKYAPSNKESHKEDSFYMEYIQGTYILNGDEKKVLVVDRFNVTYNGITYLISSLEYGFLNDEKFIFNNDSNKYLGIKNGRYRENRELCINIDNEEIGTFALPGIYEKNQKLDELMEKYSAQNSATKPVEKKEKGVIVEKVDHSTSGSNYRVYGTVTNNTSNTVKFIKVKISMKDTNGKVIDTESTYACGDEGLKPGESTKFECYIKQDSRAKSFSAEVYEYD